MMNPIYYRSYRHCPQRISPLFGIPPFGVPWFSELCIGGRCGGWFALRNVYEPYNSMAVMENIQPMPIGKRDVPRMPNMQNIPNMQSNLNTPGSYGMYED